MEKVSERQLEGEKERERKKEGERLQSVLPVENLQRNTVYSLIKQHQHPHIRH